MGRTEADIKEIKAMIAVAKQKSVNVGICLGKTPDSLEIKMDRNRSPGALGRDAKAAGDTAKVAVGTMTVDSKTVTVMCEDKPPTGLDRQLKNFFKSIDIPMKFIIENQNV